METKSATVKKNPLLAGLLSFLCVPVGFLYLGRMNLFWYFFAFMLTTILAPVFASNLITYLLSLAALALLSLIAIILSTYLAFKGRELRALNNLEKVSIPLILIASITFNIFAGPHWKQAKGYSHYNIPSGAMLPTLKIGDYVFARSVAGDDLTYGDVIIFQYPEDHSIDFIKRVVALPGDIIEYRNKILLINGVSRSLSRVDQDTELLLPPLTEEAIENFNGSTHKIWRRMSEGRDFGPIKIPQNHYFVMGDNRDNSNDSRVWGFLNEALIRYQAEYRFNINEMDFKIID